MALDCHQELQYGRIASTSQLGCRLNNPELRDPPQEAGGKVVDPDGLAKPARLAAEDCGWRGWHQSTTPSDTKTMSCGHRASATPSATLRGTVHAIAAMSLEMLEQPRCPNLTGR